MEEQGLNRVLPTDRRPHRHWARELHWVSVATGFRFYVTTETLLTRNDATNWTLTLGRSLMTGDPGMTGQDASTFSLSVTKPGDGTSAT